MHEAHASNRGSVAGLTWMRDQMRQGQEVLRSEGSADTERRKNAASLLTSLYEIPEPE